MARSFGFVKIQSAMEYLMTYGWAILIIAVVLGVLFQLGVFSSSSFSVRAPPGACQVLRTTAGISLIGQCSGQMPQYVGSFSNWGYVTAANSPTLNPVQAVTVAFWMKFGTFPSSGQWLTVVAKSGMNNQFFTYIDPAGPTTITWSAKTSGGQAWCSFSSALPNTWRHYVATYDSSSSFLKLYLNGVYQQSCGLSGTLLAGSGPVSIGGGASNLYSMANVQIYNASLDSDQIQALYSEGIGGAPVKIQSIMGWWPLNGDAKDYSGNGNNGALTSVSFKNQWTEGYAIH
jgi:hypothetical protein